MKLIDTQYQLIQLERQREDLTIQLHVFSINVSHGAFEVFVGILSL
jgi:hypothetical protein